MSYRLNIPIVLQGYGLTETTCGVLMQDPLNYKNGSVGIPKADVYVKVIDPVSGKALGPNQPGEMCFKSSYIMKGYVGDANSTNDAIRDGWLHTGDIGYYDETFEFFIVDRLKELIKYKGHQVPPAELEGILLSHKDILDAAVVGKPDEEAGELPTAFVVKRPNSNLMEKDVQDFVSAAVSPIKRLRGGVMFTAHIPKTASGKILRRELRDQLIPKSKL